MCLHYNHFSSYFALRKKNTCCPSFWNMLQAWIWALDSGSSSNPQNTPYLMSKNIQIIFYIAQLISDLMICFTRTSKIYVLLFFNNEDQPDSHTTSQATCQPCHTCTNAPGKVDSLIATTTQYEWGILDSIITPSLCGGNIWFVYHQLLTPKLWTCRCISPMS